MTLTMKSLSSVGLGKSKRSAASWLRLIRRKPKHERLKKGQRFQECDKRFTRIVEIVGFKDGRVKIKTIVSESNSCQPHVKPSPVGRITTARRDRFHRRSHGYRRLYGHCHECQLGRGAQVPRGELRGVTMTIGICCGCLKPNSSLVPSSDYNWPSEGRLAIFD